MEILLWVVIVLAGIIILFLIIGFFTKKDYLWQGCDYKQVKSICF